MKRHNELNKRVNLVNWFGLNLRLNHSMSALSKLTAKPFDEHWKTLFYATHFAFSSNYFSPQCCTLWRNYLTVLLTTIFLIACGGSDGASRYTVGGKLNGLALGNSITVSNNGLDNITLTANGTFAFPTSSTNGAAYNLSIVTLPISQPCTYTYGAGTVTGANVGSINLFCGPIPIDAWSAAGNLAIARSSHTATLLANGKVLVAGGLGATGILSSAELF